MHDDDFYEESIVPDDCEVEPLDDGEPKTRTRRKATDEQCKSFVERVLNEHPYLIEKCSHWSSSLVAILTKIKYKPAFSLCANQDSFSAMSTTAIAVVQKHVTPEMLEDIEDKVEAWVNTHIEMTDEDGNPVPGEVLVSGDREPAVKAAKKHKEPIRSDSESLEGWGSW